MDTDERKKLIAQYKDGYRVVAEALATAKDEELDARPAPGKWSACLLYTSDAADE